MKTLNLKQMEGIEGGVDLMSLGCTAYAFASIIQNDCEFGSVEAAIIGSIAYGGCMEQYY